MPSSDLERIAAIEDPYQLIRVATERLSAAQQEVTELARLRRRVIQEVHAQGVSYAQIAEQAGLSRGRIHQIKHTGPAPEGAFLGTGTITLATPLKREATNARPVVAMEDVTAAKRLEDLARGFGLALNLEHVPLGGQIDLNRPNLIVICGPAVAGHGRAATNPTRSSSGSRTAPGPCEIAARGTATGRGRTPTRRARWTTPISGGWPGRTATATSWSSPASTHKAPSAWLIFSPLRSPPCGDRSAMVGSPPWSGWNTTRRQGNRSGRNWPARSTGTRRSDPMSVIFATDAAPGRPNEDFVAATPNAVVLLDGSGTPAGSESGCVHGVAWYTQSLGSTLIAALVQDGKPLTEILAEAIKAVASLHDFVCDLTHPGSPSATVVMIRRTAGTLDYLVLADSVLVLDVLDEAEPTVVCDDREAQIGAAYRASMDALPSGGPEHAEALRRYVEGFAITATVTAASGLPPSTPSPPNKPSPAPSRPRRYAPPRCSVTGLPGSPTGSTWPPGARPSTCSTHSGPAELIRRVREAEQQRPGRLPAGLGADSRRRHHGALETLLEHFVDPPRQLAGPGLPSLHSPLDSSLLRNGRICLGG